MELPALYRQMIRARAYELAVKDLWERGEITGEMHLGTGEEAIAAGVVTHLAQGDALALTHRCSPALVVRGVPLVPMLRELMGREDGLCGGRGGHMHLFSKALLACTSGIVGASLPAGVGFALANTRLRPRAVAVSFTGAGAMNQGMALEAMNLAVVWKVPLLVVCVDNGWAITTSTAAAGGGLSARAAAFGWHTAEVDGSDVEAVHAVAGEAIDALRRRGEPRFVLATCPRLDGHYLGDALPELVANPLGRERGRVEDIVGAVTSVKGGSLGARARSVMGLTGTMVRARMEARHGGRRDPVSRAGRALGDTAERARIEAEARAEIAAAVEEARHG